MFLRYFLLLSIVLGGVAVVHIFHPPYRHNLAVLAHDPDVTAIVHVPAPPYVGMMPPTNLFWQDPKRKKALKQLGFDWGDDKLYLYFQWPEVLISFYSVIVSPSASSNFTHDLYAKSLCCGLECLSLDSCMLTESQRVFGSNTTSTAVFGFIVFVLSYA